MFSISRTLCAIDHVHKTKKAPSELTDEAFINEIRRRSTLPQGPPCSTIDDERLSFRVRNGTGRFPLSMAAETLSSFSVCFSTYIGRDI